MIIRLLPLFILILSFKVGYSQVCLLNTFESIQNGSATVTTSTLDIGGVNDIFDGNPSTLARSANINPLIVTISFNNTINLDSIRVIQSYGNGWFTLESANTMADMNGHSGSYQLLLNALPTQDGLPVIQTISASKKVFRLTVQRTTGDNYVHLSDWQVYGRPLYVLTNLAARNLDPVIMYKTWKLYLQKTGFWRVPSMYTINNLDTVNLSNSCINWSVLNTTIAEIVEGTIVAKNAGTTLLVASLGGQTTYIPLNVIEPVLPLQYETNISSFLATPASCHIMTIPVVVIIYLPTNDGININAVETDMPPQTLTAAKSHILRINSHTKFSLEEGSKFRGYADVNAQPYVGYKIIDYIFVYEPEPRGFPKPGSQGVFYGDYNQVISRFNGKRYVDTLGVKEFWIMGYHHGEIEPVESNMSSPTTGDISNSNRFADDMPVYSSTYVMYNYNMTRTGNEATHNHGHQIEAMCKHVANLQDGNDDMFEKRFVGHVNQTSPYGRCGDTHHPPNVSAAQDYEWNISTLVASDIKDWKPAGGATTMVNNNTWGSINYNWPSELYPLSAPNVESNWYIFWMQSIPGNGNAIPYNSNKMTNWWRFMCNWNSSTAGIGLYSSSQALNVSLCDPYETKAAGLWSNPATWFGNNVPPAGAKVIIKHEVTANENVLVSEMDVMAGGNLQVAPGVKVELAKDK